MPTVGSLFSGIGGLDLGLERAGWEVRWQVEIDEWCRKVLTKHWPDIPKYSDVRELSGDELEAVDLIAGGFPCQPVSCAGRREAQADPRWLWPEFIRIVSEVQPRLVLVENVPGLLHRGMAEVIGDLSSCGYDTEWDCIPAAAVGAPHLRYRVFVVAYHQGEQVGTAGQPREHRSVADVAYANEGRRRTGKSDLPRQPQPDPAGCGEVAHAQGFPRQDGQAPPERQGRPSGGSENLAHASSAGLAVGQQPEDERGDIWQEGPAPTEGSWWTTEPNVGRVAHGVPSRVDRLRGLGNAVVPQVAEWVGRRMLEVTKGTVR